jgi:hypothetical protein
MRLVLAESARLAAGGGLPGVAAAPGVARRVRSLQRCRAQTYHWLY